MLVISKLYLNKATLGMRITEGDLCVYVCKKMKNMHKGKTDISPRIKKVKENFK